MSVGDTTRFLRQRAKYWSPVLTRGMLWFGIAVLTDLRHGMAEMSKQIAAGHAIQTLDWADVFVGAALAGFVSVRIFLDQTLSRHVEDKKRDGLVPPPSGGTEMTGTKLKTLG